MEKILFQLSEVIAFVEDLIQSNASTDEQEEMYSEFQWTGKLNKNNYTYKTTLLQMRKLWSQKY